ncbi:MAG: sigma-70 family RNA polymerase sigma factor, partial [Ignavibacteria bacterium]|nr:sigma-70 family RNA polymerase sigma factor [Ignavibacteria bacterium]
KKKIIEDPGLSISLKEEFEVLVKRNMRRAYFSALGLLGSHDAAMDITQEAFIRAYRSFKNYNREKKFFTWYYRILKNLCLNFIRDGRGRKETEYIETREDEYSPHKPDEVLENKELTEKIQEAINELEFNDREVIILKEFEDHTYKEMSEILNIPVGSVMSRLFYARKKLAEKLKRKMQ